MRKAILFVLCAILFASCAGGDFYGDETEGAVVSEKTFQFHKGTIKTQDPTRASVGRNMERHLHSIQAMDVSSPQD